MQFVWVFRSIFTQHFPKELSFLAGFWSYRINFHLKIPYLFTWGLFLKDKHARAVFGHRSETDIQLLTNKKGTLIGTDAFTGELAFLFPLFQCWFKIDWFSKEFFQTKRFMVFLATAYFSKEDMRFKLGILGFCLYIRFGKRI